MTVQAALNACATLNARLNPFRDVSDDKRGVSSFKCDKDDVSSLKISIFPRGAAYKTNQWVKLVSSIPSDVSLNVEGNNNNNK